MARSLNKNAMCMAVAEGGHINLIISKDEDGYEEFATALDRLAAGTCQPRYGDIIDADGKHRTGLVIAVAPANPTKRDYTQEE